MTFIGLKLLALFTVHMLPLEYVKEFTMELVTYLNALNVNELLGSGEDGTEMRQVAMQAFPVT